METWIRLGTGIPSFGLKENLPSVPRLVIKFPSKDDHKMNRISFKEVHAWCLYARARALGYGLVDSIKEWMEDERVAPNYSFLFPMVLYWGP